MLDDDIKAGLIAAMRDAARTHVVPRFRQLAHGEISTKSGPGDLVTIADTEAERAFTAAIRTLWPAAEVLGEEAVAADKGLRARMGTADWAVVVDPVDGTWNFAKGLTVFGMILSVFRRGVPVWGVLYDPLMDDWIAADGHAAHLQAPGGASRRLATSTETRPERMVGYLSLGLFRKPERQRIAPMLAEFSRATSLRCACHEYRMLAEGHVDFCLSGPVPHPWDHGAGVLAVTAAGGKVAFIDGAPYTATREKGVILAANSPAVWDMLAARFAFLA